MNCHNIIAKYLNENGCDGLYNFDIECGCGLDDLMPCDGERVPLCEAGYKIPDTEHEGFYLYGPKEVQIEHKEN